MLGRFLAVLAVVGLGLGAVSAATPTDGATKRPPDAVTADGGRYYGALVDGKRQGLGRVEWDSGTDYEGMFDQGLYSGLSLIHI